MSCVADSSIKFLTDAFFPFLAFEMLVHWWEKYILPCDVRPSGLC